MRFSLPGAIEFPRALEEGKSHIRESAAHDLPIGRRGGRMAFRRPADQATVNHYSGVLAMVQELARKVRSIAPCRDVAAAEKPGYRRIRSFPRCIKETKSRTTDKREKA